jgi:hypothetical protein
MTEGIGINLSSKPLSGVGGGFDSHALPPFGSRVYDSFCKAGSLRSQIALPLKPSPSGTRW